MTMDAFDAALTERIRRARRSPLRSRRGRRYRITATYGADVFACTVRGHEQARAVAGRIRSSALRPTVTMGMDSQGG
jgi:hypothetical protein